ncbi:hypothetical protein ASC72_05520 [Flavobacterium sp. Root420]|nr:hypothetical protein ASC72_05520 [Flavobacterium sp. Root420]
MPHQNKRKNEINNLQYVLYDAGAFRRDAIVVYFQTSYIEPLHIAEVFFCSKNEMKPKFYWLIDGIIKMINFLMLNINI